jgi:hypothetical protein
MGYGNGEAKAKSQTSVASLYASKVCLWSRKRTGPPKMINADQQGQSLPSQLRLDFDQLKFRTRESNGANNSPKVNRSEK